MPPAGRLGLLGLLGRWGASRARWEDVLIKQADAGRAEGRAGQGEAREVPPACRTARHTSATRRAQRGASAFSAPVARGVRAALRLGERGWQGWMAT